MYDFMHFHGTHFIKFQSPRHILFIFHKFVAHKRNLKAFD